MTIESFFVRTVQIRRPGTVEDRYGDTVTDWDATTVTTVRGWLAQTSSDERNDHRSATITRAVVYLPAGTDIVAGDRVAVDGTVWEVVGVPNVGHDFDGPHHIEAALTAVEG